MPVVRRLGRDPDSRVRWLIAFAGLDVGKLSEAAWRRAWEGVWLLQSGQRVRVPPPPSRGPVIKAQQTLREAVEALSCGRPYELLVPELIWTLSPAIRRAPGVRRSASIARRSLELSRTRFALPAALNFALVDLLNQVGADRLRRCPLELAGGAACGVIFLAERRQTYCSPRHASAAAWHAYLSRGGDVARKLRRA
jgi:hypothetical protein